MKPYAFSLDPVKVPFVETANRTIKTAIPAPGTRALLERLQKVESRSMQGQIPIVWDRAEGWSVFDQRGNRWIDFTSTIFVTTTGHANPHVIQRAKELLDRPLLHTYAYINETRADYLEALIRFAGKPFEKAFLLSAGTEATEAALKLMRLNGQKTGKRKPGILCVEGNWHGRTMGAQLMSSNVKQKEWIGQADANIHYIPFPYPWALQGKTPVEFLNAGLEKLRASGVDLEKDITGIMLETFQGWGAVFYPVEFVRELRKIADQNQILLAFDEMQAGFARTGKKFGFQHYGVEPDLICCGKGMGSGFPISGVLGRAHIMDLPETGDMSSTHSANPVVCAAGLATIEVIERENLVAEAERKGEILHGELNRLLRDYPEELTYVLGKGMIAALLFKRPAVASRVAERCMQKGLLVVHTGRESIKLGPPVVISDAALLEATGVLREALSEILAETGPNVG